MAKTMIMSERDKNLIYFCVLFAISAFAYLLVISPLNDKISDANEEYEILSGYVEDMQYEAGMADIYEKEYNDNLQKYNSVKTALKPVMATDEIDKEMTGQMIRMGLTPTLLEVSQTYDSDFLLQYTTDPNEESDTYYDEYDRPYSEYIVSRNVYFRAMGRYEDITKFLDYINSQKGTVMVKADFESSIAEFSDAETQTAVTGQYKVYMFDNEKFEKSILSEKSEEE